jgi:hypothetical protein
MVLSCRRDFMPSFTTIYRAVVMLAVGAIVFKGWQLYGPSAEQVKSVAVRAVDMAQTAWKNFHSSDKDAQSVAPVRVGAPPIAQTNQQSVAEVAIVPPALSQQSLTPIPSGDLAPIVSAPSSQPPITPLAATGPAASTNDERVDALMSRLRQLGGTDPKLAPWGSSGHLHRCSCQAPLANSTAVKQHFESVATEPALAVEQVVAKVEAWQMAQRNVSLLR